MSNASLTSTNAQTRTPEASRTLPVLSLIVAGAAAVLSVFAIATDDVGTSTTSVAVQQSAPRSAIAPAPIVTVHRSVDGCGRPIVHGQDSCW